MDVSTRPAIGKLARSVLDLVATIAIIAAAGLLLWRNWPKSPNAPPLPTQPLSLADAATTGDGAARVVIIEYSDFQCPYCGQFARNTLPELERRYVRPGQVLLAFRHLPLERLHPLAFRAAEAAECSRRQGKFWEMHDREFRDQQKLDSASLDESARALALDVERFDACLAGEATDQIRQDLSGAKDLAVTGTPTFFIGTVQPDGRVKVTKRLSGAAAQADFERALDQLLAPPDESHTALVSVAVGSIGVACLAAWTIRRRRRSWPRV